MEPKNKIAELVELSRYFGQNPDFVLAGGGNTSYKNENTLYVKSSGCYLASITAGGFAALDRKKLRAMLSRTYPSEPRMREESVKNDLLSARLFPEKNQRPSVESNFHEIIDYPWTVHIHPAAVNSITCAKEGKKFTEEIFESRVLWIDYTDPGFKLACSIKDKINLWTLEHKSCPGIIFMQNHGMIASGNTPAEVKKSVDEVISVITKKMNKPFPSHIPAEQRTMPAEARQMSLKLRGALRSRKILYALSLDGIEGMQEAKSGPITPDQIVYCRPEVIKIKPKEKNISAIIEKYIKKRGYEPSVFIVNDIAVFGAGADLQKAKTSAEVFWDSAKTIIAADAFGGARFLTAKQSAFIDSWEVESYRRKLCSAPERELEGMVAVVTGAAQGIGKGIAEALAKMGASVAVADLNIKKAEETAEVICGENGGQKAIAIEVDITDESAVDEMFCRVIDAYGGIDLLVNNAGILISGNILDLKYEAFKKVIDINLNASYLCAQKAAKVMAVQGRGDIIQMSSKSGKSGSRNNSAYACSKFAAIGLTQSIAMDLIPHNIYVNALCPGNFLDLDLWQSPGGLFDQYLAAGKVAGAKTKKDVEEHYKKQTLLGRGCTVEDIMHTILYILKQRGETGQAYNITQGQTMT